MDAEVDAARASAKRFPATARRLLTAIFLGLAITMPPLVLIPVELHASNPYEFSVSAAGVLPSLLLAAAIPLLLIVCCAVIAPRKWDPVMTAVLLALALLVWVQGQLIVPDYGVLDGDEIAWFGQPGWIVFDAILWVLLPLFVILARKKLRRWAGLIAAALLLIQALPAARAMVQMPAVPEFHHSFLEDQQAFSFSEDRNVIMIVLDAFQADVFGQLLEEEPGLRKQLSGFTWFRNALAGYSKTYPSFALMLTGRWYDNDVPIQAFIKRSFLDHSIPRELISRGWQVDLLPRLKRVVYPSSDVASNARPAAPCTKRRADVGRMMDLGLFRASPHWWKAWWINNYRWQLGSWLPASCEVEKTAPAREQGGRDEHHALEFLRRADQEATAQESGPVFRLYHLMMPHAPFMLDESLSQKRLPAGADGFKRHSRAALVVLERFLAFLKARDLYDNSLILVVADHGGGEYVDAVDTSTLPPGMAGDKESVIPGKHRASGLPLILVKPFAEEDTLSVSEAPVSLADVAATIASQLELDEGFPGRDMFTVDASAQRQRRYRFYSFDGWSGEYLPDMSEYLVDGHSWLPQSWQPSERQLMPPAEAMSSEPNTYRPGELLRFRPGAFPEEFLVNGWSRPSPHGLVWSRADQASIHMPLSRPVDGALRIRLDYLPYDAGGAIDSPRVHINVNGATQEWRNSGRGWREFCVPASIVDDAEMLEIRFEFPDAASPLEQGTGRDSRQLGIALYQLEALSCTVEEH